MLPRIVLGGPTISNPQRGWLLFLPFDHIPPWLEGCWVEERADVISLLFQMEHLWAGGLEERMRHTPTGEALCLILKNALADWREIASILSITATVMPTEMNGDFHVLPFTQNKVV